MRLYKFHLTNSLAFYIFASAFNYIALEERHLMLEQPLTRTTVQVHASLFFLPAIYIN
jgi:hypothetical protein